jgi:putative solute:sodium symporter small subunit
MANGATSSQHEAHWEKTKTLTIITMVIWAFFSFGIHWFATALNSFTFFGWPIGFYMAAQGSLIVFVVLIWWSANRQEKIDEEFGFAEDEQ